MQPSPLAYNPEQFIPKFNHAHDVVITAAHSCDATVVLGKGMGANGCNGCNVSDFGGLAVGGRGEGGGVGSCEGKRGARQSSTAQGGKRTARVSG